MNLRAALRAAAALPIAEAVIAACIEEESEHDLVFAHAWREGLDAVNPSRRSGHFSRVVGEVAESVAEVVLDGLGYRVFWHTAVSGIQGVDLLFLAPDETVLALEVKGTLRAATIPRLTPSKLRQMSRDWLNRPGNPAMREWSFEADDLYAGVMVVDLATRVALMALSADFESYVPVTCVDQLLEPGSVSSEEPS